MYVIDSYQNLVYASGGEENESMESVTPSQGGDSVEHSGEENRGASAADAGNQQINEKERDTEDAARNSVSRTKKGREERRQRSGHGSADRNESRFSREGEHMEYNRERGRAASGDPFEDKTDNAFLHSHRRLGSPDRRHKSSTDHRR